MPTFRYDKLVRDNIPTFHAEAGHVAETRSLEGKELSAALIAKLHEEVDEVSSALSPEELLEEIADVWQVIDTLVALHGITKVALGEMIAKKTAKKGAFSQGYYIETVTMPNEDDEWVAYCRKSPEKYPEVR